METSIEDQLKSLRHEISALGLHIKELPQNRNVALCYTATQRSKMWLGKVLGIIDVPSPYLKDGERKDVKDIEPEAEKAETIISIEGNLIEKIDTIRQKSGIVADKIADLSVTVPIIVKLTNKTKYFKYNCAISEAYRAMCEVRMWLGWELGAIRDEEKS